LIIEASRHLIIMEHFDKSFMFQQKVFLSLCAVSIILMFYSMVNITDRAVVEDKLTVDAKRCPISPIATLQHMGRLGNHISSYANFIAMQWQFGYQLYLPEDLKNKLQNVFKNVTFPTIESISHCKTLHWYSMSPLSLWSGSAMNKKPVKEMNDIIKNMHDCVTKNKMDKHSCLPSAFGKALNIHMHYDHNVRIE
jgi:hypothetical protein